MEIQFSPNVIATLPMYLDTNWEQLIKLSGFRYTKSYIYNCITGRSLISQQMNTELNLLWEALGLDYEDVEAIYKINDLMAIGDSKLEQYKLKKHRSTVENKSIGGK